MVKPRYINNEVIVPKPGPKQIKDESYFIGRAPYEEETTEVEVEVERFLECARNYSGSAGGLPC